MAHVVESLLAMGPAAKSGPDGLDHLFATLDAGLAQPALLLAKYRKTPAQATSDDVSEDLTAYDQIFAFGALSILQSHEGADWRKEFRTLSHRSDGLWKAGALIRLVMFLSHGEAYSRSTNELERLLWDGDISDPTYRHLYAYEYLAQGPWNRLYPYRTIKNHGRNFVELFGTQQAITAVREGYVARLFQNGLLDEVQEIVLDPIHAAGYEAFFAACIATHERERGTVLQGHYGYETWTRARFKQLVLAWSGSEHFERQTLANVFDMIGW